MWDRAIQWHEYWDVWFFRGHLWRLDTKWALRDQIALPSGVGSLKIIFVSMENKKDALLPVSHKIQLVFLNLPRVALRMHVQVYYLPGLITKRCRKDIRQVTFSVPKWADLTLSLARGGCNDILRPFLWASRGVAEVELGSPLGALSIKTYSGPQSGDFWMRKPMI